MRIDINTDGLVRLTAKLEALHKSALPSAVRGTLNDAVFDVKTNTMLKSAKNVFENREKNFFKANSRFEKASGFKISEMKSTVGFVEGGLRGGNNYAVRDLEEQEEGGNINHKSFVPTVFARSGKTSKGLVRPNTRLSKIKNIINAKNSNGKNARERFVIAASVAGKSGYVLRGDILFRIDVAPKSNLKTKRAKLKVTPLYTFRKNRSINVNQTHFMYHAALETSKKLDDFYVKQGERQLNKVWK